MAILKFILNKDTDGFKNNLVFLNTMAKVLGKNLKNLDTPIDVFMAGMGLALKVFHFISIEFISDSKSRLPMVKSVSNTQLSFRHFAFETIGLLVDCLVMFRCFKGTIDPDKSVLSDHSSNFINKCWSIKLVRVPLGAWLGMGLMNCKMHTINSQNKDLRVVVE